MYYISFSAETTHATPQQIGLKAEYNAAAKKEASITGSQSIWRF